MYLLNSLPDWWMQTHNIDLQLKQKWIHYEILFLLCVCVFCVFFFALWLFIWGYAVTISYWQMKSERSGEAYLVYSSSNQTPAICHSQGYRYHWGIRCLTNGQFPLDNSNQVDMYLFLLPGHLGKEIDDNWIKNRSKNMQLLIKKYNVN